ncbi:MAG: FAD-dependent oxidoreductase [Pseudomonadota bacterium]
MAQKKIVIIGGSAAGAKAGARARRRDPEAKITILDQDRTISYAACGIPFYLSGEVKDIGKLTSTPIGVARDAAFFKAVKDIEVRIRTRAVRIDRQNKTVEAKNLDSGEAYSLPYDFLVLAPGAVPLIPPIEGTGLKGVFACRTLEDASRIMEAEEHAVKKAAVIIGGGLISLELSEAFSKKGITVSIVEIQDHLAPLIVDSEISVLIEDYLREKGVRFHLQERAVRIDGENAHVRAVITDKREIPADFVVIATGIRPNTKLAKDAGLELGELGGVAVNEFMETSDPSIYAGGDCVESVDIISGRKFIWPKGSLANQHGRVIGDNITGGGTTFPGVVRTAVAKIFEMNLGRSGLTEAEAKRMGYEIVVALTPAPDKPFYYPTAKPIILKMIADKKTRRVLGIQGLGKGEVVKRIDVTATAMMLGASIDQMADLDLGYAPPYSSALDNVIEAANVLRNKIDGIAEGIRPEDLREKVEKQEDFIILDCRTPKEVEKAGLGAKQVVAIPLGQVRSRLDELDRDKEVITFCKIGLRSYETARILKGAGFKNVKFVDGGLDMWAAAKPQPKDS